MEAKCHIVSIQLEVDRVFLTPSQGSTLLDFRKRQNEFLTSKRTSESTFDHQKVKQDLKHAFLSLLNHVIRELGHITRYHGPYSETS